MQYSIAVQCAYSHEHSRPRQSAHHDSPKAAIPESGMERVIEYLRGYEAIGVAICERSWILQNTVKGL